MYPLPISKYLGRLETNGDKYCDVCAKLSEKIIDTSVNDSAKIRKIIELVDEIEERSNKTEKIIIFSQFTTMLGLISKVLEEKGIKYVQCTYLLDYQFFCFTPSFIQMTEA